MEINTRPVIFGNREIYIKSVLGVKIKIINVGWDHVVTKHPELAKSFNELVLTLQKASQVYTGKIDPRIYLYYLKVQSDQKNKYLCAVCKHYNGQGFLITAYYTYKLQGKKIIWPKKHTV